MASHALGEVDDEADANRRQGDLVIETINPLELGLDVVARTVALVLMSQPPPQPPAQAPPPAAPAQPQVAKGMLPRRLGIAAPPPGGAPEGPGGLQRPGDALMTSSPYLKSMALLDSLDLQQLMAGGDTGAARRRRAPQRPSERARRAKGTRDP
ncbi:hypothetical protein SO694_00101080 [Aureococcus anophagefferens]|uniref:Uncharacterized protein n=1 Tax=Aureococcus anophagefferens TaxID=44056 RepID=A0ABR1FMY3_AURAN